MPAKDEEREKRLAAALRENLRKRKARARELGEQPGGATGGEGRNDDPA